MSGLISFRQKMNMYDKESLKAFAGDLLIKQTYDNLIEGAKQLTIFRTEEELDPRDYVFESPDDREGCEKWSR